MQFSLTRIGIVATLSAVANASVGVTVDILDGVEPEAGSIPADMVIADVYASVSGDDTFNAAGIQGVALHKAALVYSGVGLTDMPYALRYATRVNDPRPDRYTAAAFTPHVAVGGAYCPAGAVAITLPGELNSVYFKTPPPNGGTPAVSGWMARIALDISLTPFVPSDVQIFTPGLEPSGWVSLFRSRCPTGLGTVAATFDVVSPVGLDWGLYANAHVPFTWIELNGRGDSGESIPDPGWALGSGSLQSIRGVIEENDVDLYAIDITNAAQFSATTVGLADFDTQLFLFDQNGLGVVMDDDDPLTGALQSRLTSAFVTANGRYYLAISRYNRDPLNALGAPIWNDGPFNVERTPDGPGAGNPLLASWAHTTPVAGRYEIALTGTSFIAAPTGDLDGDGVVDLTDLTILLAHFGTLGGATLQDGDITGDGSVDLGDLTLLLANFGVSL
jgi:hypothetical protein